MELRLTSTITMSHQPTIDLSCITNSYKCPTNRPIMFHDSFIPISSIQIPIYHIEHTCHHTWTV